MAGYGKETTGIWTKTYILPFKRTQIMRMFYKYEKDMERKKVKKKNKIGIGSVTKVIISSNTKWNSNLWYFHT